MERSIKALSVKQPWANLIAEGAKTIETRTWATRYRGPLLICSSKYPKIEPYGCGICLVELVGCRPMVPEDETAACCKVYRRAYSWLLRNPRPFVKPFKVVGRLGLFEVPEKVLARRMVVTGRKPGQMSLAVFWRPGFNTGG